jgi:ribosomal-protein-alanine N-acetyltransferase
MTEFAVVAAGPGDVGLLADLQNHCFVEPWGQDGVAKMLALSGAFATLARATLGRRRQAVGFSVCQVVMEQADLLTLGILPGLRRRGFGRLLLVDTLTRCRQLGATHLFLEVAEDNEPARQLYERSGFDVIGRRKGYYRDAAGAKVTALVLRRALGDQAPPLQPADPHLISRV